jgi:digeranylgeranylglycerophospholipid reductase
MPSRRTKRGTDRSRLHGRYDAIVCGASFAGLATARELSGARLGDGRRPRVLLLDRYEVGERQTSACAAPTAWLEALGLERSIRQTFGKLVLNTPHTTVRFPLPWTFSTFDYPELCRLLADAGEAEFETATVLGREPATAGEVAVRTDCGDVSAPLVVDALGWRRVLAGDGYQPPEAPLSRGLEVHPSGSSGELEVWIDRTIVPAGYGWSFPADDEVRVGVGSFDPRFHVKDPTVVLAGRLERDAVRYQGNWIPHELREGTEGKVFFVGDSAGHCLPLTAEGIRTAFYFGIALGRELRDVLGGNATRDSALDRYAAFCALHERKFTWMLRAQRLVPRVPPRLLALAVRGIASRRLTHWAFGHYLEVAHPRIALEAGRAEAAPTAPSRLAA